MSTVLDRAEWHGRALRGRVERGWGHVDVQGNVGAAFVCSTSLLQVRPNFAHAIQLQQQHMQIYLAYIS